MASGLCLVQIMGSQDVTFELKFLLLSTRQLNYQEILTLDRN